MGEAGNGQAIGNPRGNQRTLLRVGRASTLADICGKRAIAVRFVRPASFFLANLHETKVGTVVKIPD